MAIIEDLLRLLREALEIGHHHPNPEGVLIVQVVMNDTQKTTLHAQEQNAEGETIDRDSATAAWTSDRQDVVTLTPSDDGFSCDATSVGGGAFGDTTVTVTLTEPGTTDDQGNVAPGRTYVGTQVVTVSEDETIASVEITADEPVAK